MPNPNQVLVISVKGTELTSVLPIQDDGTIDIAATSQATVDLFKAYLDGFTTLQDFEKKAHDGQMDWLFDVTFKNLSEFCKDANQKKFHLMKKVGDVKNKKHDFCLCYQRITMMDI